MVSDLSKYCLFQNFRDEGQVGDGMIILESALIQGRFKFLYNRGNQTFFQQSLKSMDILTTSEMAGTRGVITFFRSHDGMGSSWQDLLGVTVITLRMSPL